MKHIYYILLAVTLLLASCSEKTTQLTFKRYIYESVSEDTIVKVFGELPSEGVKNGEPVCYVAYDLEFPVGAINEDVLRRLQLNLLSILSGAFDQTAADSHAEMERFFAGMKLTESDTCPVDPIMLPEGKYNITTYNLNVVRTINNADSLYTLCFSQDYYAFGAVHGQYSLKYYSFSTVTGNALTFDSLFVAGADTVFFNYMIKQIPLDYKESNGEEFEFQGEPLVENGSFYFTPEGVIFSFSPYSIASFAAGQIDCLIPSSISKPLLQKNWQHLLNPS